jgi:hypothetical protein
MGCLLCHPFSRSPRISLVMLGVPECTTRLTELTPLMHLAILGPVYRIHLWLMIITDYDLHHRTHSAYDRGSTPVYGVHILRARKCTRGIGLDDVWRFTLETAEPSVQRHMVSHLASPFCIYINT